MDDRRVEAGRYETGLRIMTYNVRAGLGATGDWGELGARPDEEALGPVAALIQSWQPHLVALQEVVILDRAGRSINQAGWLARSLGMKPLFGPVISLRGGFWGNALLSRLPVLGARTHPLEYHPKDDPRALLEVELEVDGQPLTCYSAHLSYRPVETARQAGQVARFARRALERGPVVLAGDFNAPAWSQSLAELPLYGRDAFSLLGVASDDPSRSTFPSGHQRCRALDHIFLSQDLEPVDCQVIVDHSGVSDHNPVVVDCRLASLQGARAARSTLELEIEDDRLETAG